MPVFGPLAQKAGIGPRWAPNVEYGDIVKGLSVSADSCRAVYCSHVLEHLALEDFRIAIRNTYKYLEKEGVFRFVLPDLKTLVEAYVSSEKPDAAIDFMHHTLLGVKSRPKGVSAMLSVIMGNSNHLWMWDYESIREELSNIGFRHIRKASYLDSKDEKFIEVESEARWKRALGVECKK